MDIHWNQVSSLIFNFTVMSGRGKEIKVNLFCSNPISTFLSAAFLFYFCSTKTHAQKNGLKFEHDHTILYISMISKNTNSHIKKCFMINIISRTMSNNINQCCT